ncbi:MAG: glyoxylate/hydroxypyruvate reductase A [Pseudomonadota bacterium]|nr:glyoxylate/hydroxypyruvate reductase A [Pseudomonadota bacterium]
MSGPGALLLKIDEHRVAAWTAALADALPEMRIRIWPDIEDPNEIRYALLWKPPATLFEGLESLEVIFSVGAGFDHLLACPTLPAGIPVIRMVEPELTAGMVEYVVFNVLRYHRRMDQYQRFQEQRVWQVLDQIPAHDTTVGIMGLGVMGAASARVLACMNYRLLGWSRTGKTIPGLQSFVGTEELGQFLAQTRILVILLPLSRDTRKLIDRDVLWQLPRGAFLINAGRGELVNQPDLIEALDNGQIAGAALDVFDDEPLPAEHRFWRHPMVVLTPHIASLTNPPTAVEFVAENIERHRAGHPLRYVVDFERGY